MRLVVVVAWLAVRVLRCVRDILERVARTYAREVRGHVMAAATSGRGRSDG